MLVPVALATLATLAGASPDTAPCSSARTGPDPCAPHGKTDILTGKCGDAGSANPTNTSCFTCYTGPRCSEQIPDCLVVETCGWPLMMSEIWGRFPCPNGEPVTVIPSDFGQAYQFFEHEATLLPALERTIRAVHKLAGNADPDGYHVLPGNGGTGAALYVMAAIAKLSGSVTDKIQVFAQPPFFPDYEGWPRVADQTRMEWNPDADPAAATTLEILNSPANPTGALRTPHVANKSMLICDFVYDWPYLKQGGVQSTRCDVMIYSMSKITGHAGSRFGWALIKDRALYEAAIEIMLDLTLGISVDAQVRAHTLLTRVVAGGGDFFRQGRAMMDERWDRLARVMAGCTAGVTVANADDRGPNAWLATPPGTNATATLLKGGLYGWEGDSFGATSSFVRFSLLDSNSTMELIFAGLAGLCKLPAGSALVPVTPGAPRARMRSGRRLR